MTKKQENMTTNIFANSWDWLQKLINGCKRRSQRLHGFPAPAEFNPSEKKIQTSSTNIDSTAWKVCSWTNHRCEKAVSLAYLTELCGKDKNNLKHRYRVKEKLQNKFPLYRISENPSLIFLKFFLVSEFIKGIFAIKRISTHKNISRGKSLNINV
jgi:hypothetical protein